MIDVFGDPASYEFFQAVREVERVLAASGAEPGSVLRQGIRFPNSTSLGFAAGEVESMTVDGGAAPSSARSLAARIRAGEAPQVSITPTFIGILGAHGTLPLHYTEAVQSAAGDEFGNARLAFLDTLSSRLVSMFYEAWKAQRFELAADDDSAALRPRLRALAAAQENVQPSDSMHKLETYFAGLLRHRPVSAVALEQVLASYFDMQVEVKPGIPTRHPVPVPCQAQLGGCTLSDSAPCVLGSHMYRRDMRCAITLYPQTGEKALALSCSGAGAAELRNVLGLFAVPTTEFEVAVVVAKEQVCGTLVDGMRALGLNSYLLFGPALDDRADMRYIVRTSEGADTNESH